MKLSRQKVIDHFYDFFHLNNEDIFDEDDQLMIDWAIALFEDNTKLLKILSDLKEIPEKNGWHFEYKFLQNIENITELNGEYVSMEGVESVLLSLIEYLNENKEDIG